jgi:hypothetical protein
MDRVSRIIESNRSAIKRRCQTYIRIVFRCKTRSFSDKFRKLPQEKPAFLKRGEGWRVEVVANNELRRSRRATS